MKRWTFKVADSQRGLVNIEKVDKDFLRKQVSIALKAYEKESLPHQGALKNILGLAAELAFKEWLEELGLKDGEDFEWNERRADYWEEGKDRRPWDFRLRDGTAFEIGAARPFHRYAVFMLKKHKEKSKYFVQVQIKRFKATINVDDKGKERWYDFDANYRGDKLPKIADPEQIKSLKQKNLGESNESGFDLGEAVICGFDAVETILAKKNGWRLSLAGAVITPYEKGMIKPLSEVEPLEKLKRLILKGNTREKKKRAEAN